MKVSAAFALALMFPSYAYALDSASYSKTLDVFMGGTTIEDYIAHYSDRILSNLQGKWVGMTGIGSSDFDSVFPKACGLNPYFISGVGPLGFDMVRGKDGSNQVHSHYSLMTGNTFVQTTPQEDIVKYLGIDAKTEFDKRIANSNQNGIATIIKPEEDIVVIQRNYGVPAVFVKCPS
ncbi:hypothetical protein [Mesorhizobium loti]|uniref:Uncharacterized protein n=1 Tax=Mesorhizobium loti R88b TaxID=935548 RepID=A0A6M7WQQ6_RHILI|nr:hypothetical protein [Mesorhizobium loti]QKD03856.1 hypothetical protein EB235_22160 [Mesorhizobium loti R88b]